MHGHRTIVAALCSAFLLALLPGCEAWQRALGSPTQAEVDAAQNAIEAAEKAVEEAVRERDALAREVESAKRQAATVEAQRQTLSAIQSRIALELANAPEDARPFLEAQLDDIRRQSRAIDDRRAAWASRIAGFDGDLAAVDAKLEANQKQLATADEEIAAMQEQARAANERASGLLSQVGSTITTAFPVAAPFLEVAGPWLVGGLAATGPVFGLAAARSRKRAKELERERDGARKVIAVTERHGLAQIANDPNTKEKARIELAADPVAMEEFAKATAEGRRKRYAA